jgi:hypothetical protein
MAYYLFGKYFTAGASENSKICRTGVVHGWLIIPRLAPPRIAPAIPHDPLN